MVLKISCALNLPEQGEARWAWTLLSCWVKESEAVFDVEYEELSVIVHQCVCVVCVDACQWHFVGLFKVNLMHTILGESCYLALYTCCVWCRHLMFLLPGALHVLCLMPLFDVPVTWRSTHAAFDAVICCSCYLALYMCCVWCRYLMFLLPGTLNVLCLMSLFDLPVTWYSKCAVFDAII